MKVCNLSYSNPSHFRQKLNKRGYVTCPDCQKYYREQRKARESILHPKERFIVFLECMDKLYFAREFGRPKLRSQLLCRRCDEYRTVEKVVRESDVQC